MIWQLRGKKELEQCCFSGGGNIKYFVQYKLVQLHLGEI